MTDYSYDRIAEEWDHARGVLMDRERGYLDLLLSNLRAGSTVLDLGCGMGRPIAEYILSQGYHVIGVDDSEALLARARSRFPEAEWIRARMEDYPFDRPVQAVVCWDAIFHVERTYHEPIIQGMARCLPVGGRIMLSVGGSPNPPFTDTMFGQEFFYDSHNPEEEMAIVERAGFRILIGEFTDLPTGGRDKGKFTIIAEKT